MAEIDMGAVYKRLWDNDFIALKSGADEQTFRRMMPFIKTVDSVIEAAGDTDKARRQARVFISRASEEADLPFVFVAIHLWLLGVEDSMVVPAIGTKKELSDWRDGRNLPAPEVRRKLYTLAAEEWNRANNESVCTF